VSVDMGLGTIDRGGRDVSPPLDIGSIPCCVITAVAAGITATVTATGARPTTGASPGGAVLAALARGVCVGFPLAVALFAARRPASARFGRVLLVASGAWFLASLAASSSPLLYSFGRLWTWVAEVVLVYALLAFPSGRLRDRFDRVLIAVGVLELVLALSTAPFVERYPEPSSTSSCYLTCPHNVFMIVGHEPAVIVSVIDPLWLLIAAVVFVLVAARLALRIREANTLVRRTVTPVLAMAIGYLAARVGFVVVRGIAPASPGAVAAGWVIWLMVPAFAVAFLVGLVRWHLFVSAGVGAVNAGLRGVRGPEEVRGLLAAAFEDSELQIASWSSRGRRWLDAGGDPISASEVEPDRYLSEIRDGPRRVVAILHDVELADDPAFVEVAATAASVAFASGRVAARTSALVRELKGARSQIVAAGDSERRRIERDLHDGAQQHLVALGIHLELAAEKAELEQQPAEAPALRELAAETEQALEQLRALTRGLSSGTLARRGLEASVRSAAYRSPVPTTVEAKGLREYPDEIALAVYFCCLEALQNVAKHAQGARSAHVELRDSDSVLSFSISDDGPGMSDRNARVGAGMINMRDRMTTVGGKLNVQSRTGHGTRVTGRIPLAALASPTTHQDDRASRRAPTPRHRHHTDT
jgi:signal transduction histidine kinase